MSEKGKKKVLLKSYIKLLAAKCCRILYGLMKEALVEMMTCNLSDPANRAISSSP